jgi:3-oxoadipate enol-lactonase
VTLHHRIDGGGDRVLVLSGSLGSTLEMWAPQVQALAAEFRVVRYDHPGHGRSPIPEVGETADEFADGVLRLADELGVVRFSFCGLSLGGVVGMRIALRAPERVERLVLCCTAARIATTEFWVDRAGAVRRDGLEPLADTIVGRWFTAEYAAAEPATVGRYRAMLVGTPPEGYARCCEVLGAFDAREELGRIEASTLVLVGDEDPVVSSDDAAQLERGIRDSRLVVLSPAAHLANVERAAEFNRTLLSHLTAKVVA